MGVEQRVRHAVAIIRRQKKPEFSGVLSIQEIDPYQMLETFIGRGEFERITMENFPGLEPKRVALARYSAYTREIHTLLQAASVSVLPEAQQRLSSNARFLEIQRDRVLVEDMPAVKGTQEELEVLGSRRFSSNQEEQQTLVAYIALGLPNQITIDNFPSLKGVSRADVLYLKLRAVAARIEAEQTISEAKKKPIGFSHNGNGASVPNQEVKIWQDLLGELETEYSAEIASIKK